MTPVPHDSNSAIKQLGYLWRKNISCLTCGHLVYVRNLKCASTFFWHNFLSTFGWQEIEWAHIDWQTQRVFGHVLDPLQRRIKGMAEYIHMSGLTEEFKKNQKFRQFIINIPVLDQHSASYFDWFGTAAWHIDWIPIDPDHSKTVKYTDTLLEHYRIYTLDRWDYAWSHPGEPDKKHIEQLLIAEEKNQTCPEHLGWHFHNDLELWNRVTQKFNPDGKSWPNMSWLDQPTTVPYVR